MECVADLCSWFQRQHAANRLDIMVTLLQMLHPLELRFIGACVEDFARKDYYCLRENEIRTNNGQTLTQLTDLADSTCRSRLVVAISLLYSGNYATATVLYRILFSLNSILHQLPKTKEVMDEIILILTMAKHHPAFRFDQRASIAELFEKIGVYISSGQMEYAASSSSSTVEKNVHIEAPVPEENAMISPKAHEKAMVDCATQTLEVQAAPDFVCPFCCSMMTAAGVTTLRPMFSCPASPCTVPKTPPPTPSVYITNIAIKGVHKTGDENICDFKITWSNGIQTECTKRPEDLYSFHKELLDWYPHRFDTYLTGKRIIPYFPGYRDGNVGQSMTLEMFSTQVKEYINELLHLAPTVLLSENAINFFKPDAVVEDDFKIPQEPATNTHQNCVVDVGFGEETDIVDDEGRLKSLTIYNSTCGGAAAHASTDDAEPMINDDTKATAHNSTNIGSSSESLSHPRSRRRKGRPSPDAKPTRDLNRKLSMPLNIEPSEIVSAPINDSASSAFFCKSRNEFPILRSHSDASETVVSNFSSACTSNSLPPSKSQSPAPQDMSASAFSYFGSSTFPPRKPTAASAQPRAMSRNGKAASSYRSSVPIYKNGPPQPAPPTHQPPPPPPRTAFQRGPVTYTEYTRQPVYRFVSTSATYGAPLMPAANFVRAPQHQFRLVCQCNGGGSCPVGCHHPWANGPLSAPPAPNGPFLFHVTAAGPYGGPNSVFSPTFLAQMPPQAAAPHISPGHFFGNVPGANYRHGPAEQQQQPQQQQQQQHVPLLVTKTFPVMDEEETECPVNIEQHVHQQLQQQLQRVHSCCNCGVNGHTRDMCGEPTLDDVTSASSYHISYAAKDESTSQDR